MAFWNIGLTKVNVIPAGVNAPNDYIFQNTGANTIYISDQQDVTADSTSLAIATGTPFTWSKSDPLFAICVAGSPSTLFGTANGAQVGTSIAALLTPTAQFVVAAAANTLYRSNYTLQPGIYTIAITPNTVIVNIDFYDVNGSLITSVTSTSGSNLTVNLATTAVQFDYWTTSGVNTSISITKSGTNIPFVSGTLYTYTTSQIIPLSGDAYVILVGGGGGGGSGIGLSGNLGGGGGSSGIVFSRLYLNGSQSLVIGVGGNGGAVNTNSAGSNGTATTLGALSAGGGGGGGAGQASPPAGAAGSPNGGVGGSGASLNGVASSTAAAVSGLIFLNMGSTGGGGRGDLNTPGTGAGTGIGTGGTGAIGASNTPAGNGTGFGSGGGGGNGNTSIASPGGKGTNGACYVIL